MKKSNQPFTIDKNGNVVVNGDLHVKGNLFVEGSLRLDGGGIILSPSLTHCANTVEYIDSSKVTHNKGKRKDSLINALKRVL